MTENDFYWYWLANISGIGIKTRKKLLDYLGHPREIYNCPEEKLKEILTEKQCQNLILSKEPGPVKVSAERLKRKGISFIHYESPEYPDRLRNIYEPPVVLYYIGKLPDYNRPILAMVGARKATVYGRNMAKCFAEELSKSGIQIVSGLASGVDTASHIGALDGGDYTLGILGGGIDTIYPKENHRLYQEIYSRGCVMSEYNLGIPNHKGLFPLRNRIISGIADGVFVIEAGEKSGSLITADQGLEQGKEIFALPGRITDRMSEGCNRLISQGAILVSEPADILEVFHISQDMTIQSKKNKKIIFETEEERKVYMLLDEADPVSFDKLMEYSGFSVSLLQHILMSLELKKYIYQTEQNVYLKKV